MNTRIHLSIMQPTGYVHSLGFLDQARYARHQFRRLGAEVTIGKNRLREDAINIVFGAHLGFPAELKSRYNCVFFNLEQLGEGGGRVSREYMDLLTSSAIMEYDERNLAAYGCKLGDVPVVSFLSAPYLANQNVLPIAERPIDLLFFGSINEKRKALFKRIEACGWNVSLFDQPLYSEERDQFIRQAKAVFNCHFYETSRFEQARAFHTLSLGTPLISERAERTKPPAAFENAVSWLKDTELEQFFTHQFMTPQWISDAENQLEDFAKHDPFVEWQTAYDYCKAIRSLNPDLAPMIWKPLKMNLGMDESDNYQVGWFNVNAANKARPDAVLDFSTDMSLPLELKTTGGGIVILEENSLEKIFTRLGRFDEQKLSYLLRRCLTLLKPNGIFEFELPFSVSSDATPEIEQEIWLGRAPWISLIRQPWRLGNFEYRFEIISISYLNSHLKKCHLSESQSIKIQCKKTENTLQEKSTARVFDADFESVKDDEIILN